jgi:hypothetical protein
MSGPYPPPGYPPQPGQPGPQGQPDGWWSGDQGGQGGQFGGSQYDFPTVRYSGLGDQSGGWGGEPPRRRRSVGRTVVAVVSVLVIVGGVAAGIVLLKQQHTQRAAAPAPAIAAPVSTAGGATEQPTEQSGAPAEPGVPNGSTELTLATGSCVRAEVVGDEQYKAVEQVTCGTGASDLVLATITPAMTGCADHQYLRLTAPTTGVYCFTLDIKKGDCVDENYLKTACGTAAFSVLKTESGPGSADSCTSADGATHWVPVGRDPVEVGCLGPAAHS